MTALIVVIASGCTKDRPVSSEQAIIVEDIVIEEPEDNEETDEAIADSLIAKKFVGTWVEKYPGLYDNFPDTLVFTEDFKIEKHVILQNNIYYVEKDTLFFYNPERGVQLRHQFAFISDKEVYFPDFIQNSTLLLIRPTYLIKIDEEL